MSIPTDPLPTLYPFITTYLHDLRQQLQQAVPGLYVGSPTDEDVQACQALQDWILLHQAAREGVGQHEAARILDLCKLWATRLFTIPDLSTIEIPAAWATSNTGQIWWGAYLSALRHTDTLLTPIQASRLMGVHVRNVNQYLAWGQLTRLHNPYANSQKGRTLLSKREVEQLMVKRGT